MGRWASAYRPFCFAAPLSEKLRFIKSVFLADTSPAESTFSDRRYSDEEFALILRKAGELQQQPGKDGTGGLTLADMKSVAGEVGIDADLIERAASLLPQAAADSGIARALGGPLKHLRDRSVPHALTDDQIAKLVPVIRDATQQFGVIADDPSGLAWHSGTEPSQIWVTATREGDSTRIRVTSDRTGSLAMTGGFSLLGVGVATVVTAALVDPDSTLVTLTIAAGGLAGGLTLARTLWATTTRSVRAKIDAVVDGMTTTMERDD